MQLHTVRLQRTQHVSTDAALRFNSTVFELHIFPTPRFCELKRPAQAVKYYSSTGVRDLFCFKGPRFHLPALSAPG